MGLAGNGASDTKHHRRIPDLHHDDIQLHRRQLDPEGEDDQDRSVQLQLAGGQASLLSHRGVAV